MFEIGARIQVVRRGNFFAARANKLYELYRRYNPLDELDAKTKSQLENSYFKESFDSIWSEIQSYLLVHNPEKLDKIQGNPKKLMAEIFKTYFRNSSSYALQGDEKHKVDYQIHCGPSLGAFNQWVQGTELQNWESRNVALMADKLMAKAAAQIANIVLKTSGSV